MAEVEERLAYLEGRVEEHSQMVNGIREALGSLEARMDRRFEAMDRRFEAIDRRFETIDRRFESVDLRLEGLDTKISRHFVWLVGIQVTSLIAIAGCFAAVAGGFASLAAAIAGR